MKRDDGRLAWIVNWSGTAVMWGVGWYALSSACLALRPVWALAAQTLFVVAFVSHPRLLRPRWRRSYEDVLGLTGLGRALPWVLAAAVAFVTAVLSVALLSWEMTHEPGPVDLPYRYSQLPLGTVVLAVLVIVHAPLVEEFALRGFLQGQVARRAGWLVAGTLGAAVFALFHFSRAYLPYYFLGGLVLAYARTATGSVWAAVVLHALLNAALFSADQLGLAMTGVEQKARALPLPVLSAAGALAFALAFVLLYVAGRLGGRRTKRAQTAPTARLAMGM